MQGTEFYPSDADRDCSDCRRKSTFKKMVQSSMSGCGYKTAMDSVRAQNQFYPRRWSHREANCINVPARKRWLTPRCQ